jgi:type IV secretory pathway component VirB8
MEARSWQSGHEAYFAVIQLSKHRDISFIIITTIVTTTTIIIISIVISSTISSSSVLFL